MPYKVNIPVTTTLEDTDAMIEWARVQCREHKLVYWWAPIDSHICFEEEQDALAFKLKFGLK